MSRIGRFCAALSRMRNDTIASINVDEKSRQFGLPTYFVWRLIDEEKERRRSA